MTIQGILFGPPEGKNFLYSKFGYSMRLGIYAMLFAIIIGIPAGVIAALKQNTIVDYVSLFIVTIGISVPSFVMAIFLIIIFASPCMGVYCVRLVGRGGRMVFCRR